MNHCIITWESVWIYLIIIKNFSPLFVIVFARIIRKCVSYKLFSLLWLQCRYCYHLGDNRNYWKKIYNGGRVFSDNGWIFAFIYLWFKVCTQLSFYVKCDWYFFSASCWQFFYLLFERLLLVCFKQSMCTLLRCIPHELEHLHWECAQPLLDLGPLAPHT